MHVDSHFCLPKTLKNDGCEFFPGARVSHSKCSDNDAAKVLQMYGDSTHYKVSLAQFGSTTQVIPPYARAYLWYWPAVLLRVIGGDAG